VPREQLSNLRRNIQYQEGLPQEYGNDQGEASLIVLDDLLKQVYDKDVCDLFQKVVTIEISACYFSHKLYSIKALNCRDMSLNAKYLVLLKNVADKFSFNSWHARPIPSTARACPKRIDITPSRLFYTRLCTRHRRQTKVSNQCLSGRRSPHCVCPCKG
jgi:hypothetical protein